MALEDLSKRLKFDVLNVETVLYLCAKFHKYLPYGSMGSHRLKSGRRRR